MKINWKVRVKNKMFWIAFIPALLILVKAVANVFGFDFDFTNIESNLVNIVEAVFVLLTVVGVVADPTTTGVGDSSRALTYDEPKK